MRTARWITVIVSALSLGSSACARNAPLAAEGAGEPEAEAATPLDVVVTNNNFADLKVYAMAETGAMVRLGTVNGLSSGSFKVRRSIFPTGVLRFVASPIGGSGVAQSGMLQVTNARLATFTVQPNIAASFGLVR
jgi:hypothetical protein